MAAEELADSEYPLFLTTGSMIYHWHGGEITSRAKGLPEYKVYADKTELARDLKRLLISLWQPQGKYTVIPANREGDFSIW